MNQEEPYNPAQTLIETLRDQQDLIKTDLPKDCRVVATAILMNGEQIQIVAGSAVSPELIVFIGIRDKKTVRLITRYDMIAQCVFHFEKGEPREISFKPQSLPPRGFYPERPTDKE